MLSITTLTSTLLVLWAIHTTCKTIYSVYFGPLSKIPGPKLAAATRLVLVSYSAQGRGELWRQSLHRQYGDVVRITPTDVSFATGKAWKDIYGFAPGSQLTRCQKDPAFYDPNIDSAPALVVAADGDHGRQRRCFTNAFSERALREQEPVIQQYVSMLLSNIQQTVAPTHKPNKSGQLDANDSNKSVKGASNRESSIDLAKQYNFTTFDIMADLAFGASLGCLARSSYFSWVEAILSSLKLILIITELNRHPLLRSFLVKLIPPSMKKTHQKHQQFAADHVDRRLSENYERSNRIDDIWHFVLTATAMSTTHNGAQNSKNIYLTRNEMYANAGLFMIAGTETSATLLSALTYYLLTHPEKLNRVTKEIRSAFSAADQIVMKEVPKLTYLTACIYEALRMHPPVPIGLPRIAPKGGLEIAGFWVPEKTSVSIHHLSTYRSPKNFRDPDDFVPERWLSSSPLTFDTTNTQGSRLDSDDKEDQEVKGKYDDDDKSCLQPFSVGPRNCIGQNLAWLEIRLVITHVLWHFDLELCEESRDWENQRIFSLWDTKPLMVAAHLAQHE